MSYQILFIQGAGDVTIAQEQVIVDALRIKLGAAFTIIFPLMPDADHPSYATWEAVIKTNLKRLSGNSILLGHSLGGSILLKHFSRKLIPDKVKGMLLFGAPFWKDQNWDVSEYVIDQEGVDNLRNLDNIYLYHSQDDEVIPFSQFETYRELIPKATCRVYEGVDHSYHQAIDDMVTDIRQLALQKRGEGDW